MEFIKRFFSKREKEKPVEGKVYLITNYNYKEGTLFEPTYVPPEESCWNDFKAYIEHILYILLHGRTRDDPQKPRKTIQEEKASELNKSNFLRGYRPRNLVKTSKYTLWSFLPRVLFFQMTRVANLFFIAISFLQLNEEVTDSNGIPTYFIPVLFVLLVCITREAIEDLSRWKCDEEVNSRQVQVFRNGKLQKIKLCDVHLGDVVKVHAYEYFPSDLVLLNCSDEQGICNIETKNADGESNVKYKYVNPELQKLFKTDEDAATVEVKIICEPPNDRLDSFHGVAYYSHEPLKRTQQSRLAFLRASKACKSKTTFDTRASVNIDFKSVALDMDQLLLRGTSMVNTEWAYCVAVYVGHNTRLLKGSVSASKRKLSKLETLYQRILFQMVYLMFACVVFCAIGSTVWNVVESNKHNYLQVVTRGFSPHIFFVTVGSCAILLAAMIPVDLIMIWEFVRVFQGLQIKWNNDMVSTENNIRALSKSDHLVEELGNVTHIYSDKTGTLTQNKMELVSLGFAQFGCINDVCLVEEFKAMCMEADVATRRLLRNFMLVVAVCHSVVLRARAGTNANEGDGNGNANGNRHHNATGCETSADGSSSVFHNGNGTVQVLKSCAGVDRLVLMNRVEDACQYDAASPDELALVQFAQSVGCIFTSRPKLAEIELCLQSEEMQHLFLTPDEIQLVSYNVKPNQVPAIRLVIREILQFDSVRKRMSVIIEDPQGEVLCLSKGADSAMLGSRCGGNDSSTIPEQGLDIAQVRRQLWQFANTGLRTLVYGSREMSFDEYNAWHQGYCAALQQDSCTRNEAIDKSIKALETNFDILCTSGIEDRLQEDVAQVIRDIQLAGIVVWVITGDKMETVLSIATSTALLSESVCNVILDQTQRHTLHQALNEHLENCKRGLLLSKNPMKRRLSYGGAFGYSRATAVENPVMGQRSCSVTVFPASSRYEKFAVTITGEALDLVYADEKLKHKFFKLAKYASTVIACRVTHKQKAQLVADNNAFNKDSTSLAIGDGANDVGMILAADVGVGIVGKEGMQASRCADFAIAEFRFLKSLLFVHGREALRKNMFLLYFCVFRNFSYSFMNVVYSFYCGFSGVSLFNTWSKQIINLCFTSFPLMVYVIMDQRLPRWILENYPSLYTARKNRPINDLIRQYFSLKKFKVRGIYDPMDLCGFILAGVWLSIFETMLLLKSCASTFYSAFNASVLNFGFGMFSHVMYVHHILAVNGIMCLVTNVWYWQSHFFLWGETLFLLIMWAVSSFIQGFTRVSEAHIFYGSFETFNSTLVPIFAIMISLVVSLAPFWVYIYYTSTVSPSEEDKIALELRRGTFRGVESRGRPSVSYISKVPVPIRMEDRGFCFSLDKRRIPLESFYTHL